MEEVRDALAVKSLESAAAAKDDAEKRDDLERYEFAENILEEANELREKTVEENAEAGGVNCVCE